VSNLYTLDIRVSMRQSPGYGGQLDISESIEVPATGFLEICTILGRFHELAESLKAARETS
jgi:hypothetical protein